MGEIFGLKCSKKVLSKKQQLQFFLLELIEPHKWCDLFLKQESE